MKRVTVCFSISLFTLLTMTSCAQDEFLKALKIDTVPRKEQQTADQKTISDLQKQLASAQQNETALNARIKDLKSRIDGQQTQFNNRLEELRTAYENKEASYNLQIGTLKSKLDEKDALITIQGKVIGLLDDADHTLQKSIEEQLQGR